MYFETFEFYNMLIGTHLSKWNQSSHPAAISAIFCLVNCLSEGRNNYSVQLNSISYSLVRWTFEFLLIG